MKKIITVSPKKRLITFLLAFFAGGLGAHRFYVGKTKSGFWQLFTLGGLGIWAFIDVILILAGKFTDSEGRKIVNWE